MVRQREPKWKQMLRSKATNPEWGKERLEAIIHELDHRNEPDVGYIESKLAAFKEFLADIKLAQTVWKEEEKLCKVDTS
jgi:hypothetical protein